MVDFQIHNESSAPKGARDELCKTKKEIGMLPNIFGIMAESPPELKGYLSLDALLKETTLTTEEQYVVLMAVSFENGCSYCVAAHTGEAKQAGVEEKVIQAIRNGKPIGDDRLEALRSFAAAVVQKRGHLPEEEIEAFLSAGYEKANILEVILAVGMKTISNYTNHIADTPLDKAMEPFRWDPTETTCKGNGQKDPRQT